MIDFTSAYIGSILREEIKNTVNLPISDVSTVRISPSYLSLVDVASTKFRLFTNQIAALAPLHVSTSPGLITKYVLENPISDLEMYTTALIKTVDSAIYDFGLNTAKYIKICKRLLYNNSNNTNTLNEILNYSCNNIDIIKDRDKDKSTSFSIGNFITIPYCIPSTKLYSGRTFLSASSSELIAFNNLSDIASLPLVTPALIKYSGEAGKTINTVTVNGSIDKTNLNVVYINGYGPIEEIALVLSYNGNTVYSNSILGDECLFNFEPVDADSFKITFTLSNYNQAKQTSVQIDDILLMGNVKFSKEGIFESIQSKVDHYSGINTIAVNAINYNGLSDVSFDKYVSLSFNSAEKHFYKLDDGVDAKIPTTKITKTTPFDITQQVILNSLAVSSRVASTGKSIDATFCRFPAPSGMNYKTARVLIGTNDAYASTATVISQPDGKIYENWTKIGNTYRTMLLNYESNVFVDIGLSQIKLNNQVRTGIIKIPYGISTIDVHESLFDETFGGQIDPVATNGITTDAYVYGDPLFPNNFTYKLAGLPQYQNGDTIDDTIEDHQVSGITIVQTNSPFFPFSVSIIGTIDNEPYTLHLGDTPVLPGSYTVEPNSGKIRVHAKQDPLDGYKEIDIVTITYTKASLNMRPAGILFNRMATYLDYKSISNMMAVLGIYDNTFFSFYTSGANKYMLVPYVKIAEAGKEIYHNKILFNMNEDVIYAAAKFVLKTKSSNLSPAIKNVFIQGTQ